MFGGAEDYTRKGIFRVTVIMVAVDNSIICKDVCNVITILLIILSWIVAA
jgi:hypothetical protein